MIVVNAEIPVDPDKKQEAYDLFEDLVEKSQQEEGTIIYKAAKDLEDSNTVVFFEKYEDKESLDKHTQSEHFKEFKEKLPKFLGGQPKGTMYEINKERNLDL